MATIAMTMHPRKHPLARLLSVLTRKRYPEGALSPCCREWMIADPRQDGRLICTECGGLNRKAA